MRSRRSPSRGPVTPEVFPLLAPITETCAIGHLDGHFVTATDIPADKGLTQGSDARPSDSLAVPRQ